MTKIATRERPDQSRPPSVNAPAREYFFVACRPILAVIVDRWPFPEEGQTARQRRRHKILWYHPVSQALDMGLVRPISRRAPELDRIGFLAVIGI